MKESLYQKFFSTFLKGLVFALAILLPNISDATIYYVAKTGNDLNSGTKTSPFLTIKKGITVLSAGDTLYVKVGTYKESILSWQTTIPNGTSWDNPVTVAANPGDIVIINPPSGTAFFWVQDAQAKYLIIDGFVIDGQKTAWHGFKFSNNSQYIRIRNCEIKNTMDNPILVTECSGCSDPKAVPTNTYHEFINLKVHDSGYNASGSPQHGLYIATGNNLLESSEIYNNSGYGGNFYHSYLSSSNANIIRNNTFHDNNTSGKWGCGLLVAAGKGNVVYNNVFYGNYAGLCTGYRTTDAMIYNNISYQNQYYGIYIGAGGNNSTLTYNNSVYDNGGYGIFVGDGARNAEIKNNISYKNKTGDLYLEPNDQIGTIVSSNLTEDPLFLDPAAKNFILSPNSSAIDAGLTIPEVSVDFFGVERAQGNAYDIGAIEFKTLEDTSAPATPINFRLVN